MIKYIKSGCNSFDYGFNVFDHDKKVFAYPILLSENCRKVVNVCRFSQFHEEGVYLRNDVIMPEKNCESYIKHSLICSGYNRFYTSYTTQEQASIYYRFYGKLANHLLFNLFNEIAYPPPFMYSKFEKIYKKNNWLGITESQYIEFKEKQIKEDDVIGFVCCDVYDIFDKSKCESILYMLTYKPIEYNRSSRFDMYDPSSQSVFFNSKHLKGNTSKALTWSFIFEMQKKAGIESEKLATQDETTAHNLLNFIHSNYSLLDDCQKDMCAYIYPETYNLTNQEYVQKDWLRYYVISGSSIIRENGLIIASSLPFYDQSVPKLFDKIIETIDKRKKYFLCSNIDYQIDAILDMLLINIGVSGPLKNITGLYAFYHLITLKAKQESNLINELLLLIYKSNQQLFINLISKIKGNSYSVKEEVRSWFGKRVIEKVLSWALNESLSCYFELFYEYSNNGKGFELTEEEKYFLSPKILSELELEAGESFFKQNPSIYHTSSNIDKERRFFRKELEEYVINRIDIDHDFIFKEITM